MKTAYSPAMSPDGIAWHALPIETVASLHITNMETGLSEQEARRRHGVLTESGHHLLIPKQAERRIHPQGAILAMALLLGALLVGTLQQWGPLLVFSVLAATIATWTTRETKQTRRLNELLRQQLDWRARVLRDGHLHRLPPGDLVPGDIIAVVAGDFVPADARIFAAENLTCLQTPVIPEAESALKGPAGVNTHAPMEARSSMLYLGTYVTSGNGRAIVVATGGDTVLASLSNPVPELPRSRPTLLSSLPAKRAEQSANSLEQSATSAAGHFGRS